MANSITPTETITGFGIIIGLVGTISSVVMSQQIKAKKEVPVATLGVAAVLLVGAGLVSVAIISKASK